MLLLLECAKWIAGAFLVAIISLAVGNVISSWLARVRFSKQTRGLPLLPGADLIGNHAHNVLLGDRLPKRLQEAHNNLGKTIGWLRGTDFCVSTLDLDLMKTILVDEANKHMDRIEMKIPISELDNNIATAREREWRPLRQIIAPALAPNKFKTRNVQDEIESSISKLVNLIESRLEASDSGSEFFVADDIFARYSGDLVYKSFYKQDNQVNFGTKREKKGSQLEKAMASLKDSWFVYIGTIFPQFLGLIEWLAIKFTIMGKIQARFRRFAENQVRIRLAARRQWPGLKRQAEAKGISLDPHDFELKDGTRYKHNMADYIVDRFIDGKLNEMAQEELRASVLAKGIDSDYLDWVLKESLRLLPPAPVGCSRIVTRDIKLASGHVVPKGTYVLAHAFLVHRLKEYWGEDADEFRPDRWRDTSHHHPIQYVPFGYGARGCPGRQFAMHEMKMLFVALMTRYKFAGRVRDDAYEFDSPYNEFIVPNSHTRIEISRLSK